MGSGLFGSPVPPRPYSGQRRTGAKIESLPRAGVTGVATLTAGTLYVAQLMEPIRAGETITSITFESGGTALVLGGTPHLWFSLIDAVTFKALRSTADEVAAVWGANAEHPLPLTSPYKPDVDTLAAIGVMMSVTTPANLRQAALTTAAFAARLPMLGWTGQTGATTPPADGADVRQAGVATGIVNMLYGYVS